MSLILRYFWFLAAPLMAVNVLLWRRRFAVLIERGIATELETDRFSQWANVFLVGGPVLLGIIGLLEGWSSPLCTDLSSADAPHALASAIMLSPVIGLFWWVWRGNGADFLGRVTPAFSRRPSYNKSYSRGRVRLVITAMLLLGGTEVANTWRTMPPVTPDLGCQGPVAH